ncbi:hypothetical protein GCM10027422_16310 [Hymenobacter arcticus]
MLPAFEEIAVAGLKVLGEAALVAASAAALPIAMTLGLVLLSHTPAGGPGIDQHLPPPLSPDALRLIELEEARKHQALTDDEVAELIALLAKVRGVHVTGPHELEYRYSQDIAFNHWWDQHAPTDLRQLDLQSTLDHIEYRDYSVPRGNGIGGAHNAHEWDKHKADYTEVSRTPHPSVPGVTHIKYQIPALGKDLKPTKTLKKDICEKTIYDPAIWPRPKLERALKEGLLNSYHKEKNTLIREWTGVTQEGYYIRGFYDSKTKKITTFFFQMSK